MEPGIAQLTEAARQAAAQGDWRRVQVLGAQLARDRPAATDGWFLQGLAAKHLGQPQVALPALERALATDARRYDVALELAGLQVAAYRYPEALALLDRYRNAIQASPRYLDMAGELYTAMNRHEKACELFERANALQPGVDAIRMHLATSAVYLGRIDRARDLYREILGGNPDHQRVHYELAQLDIARDRRHVDEMLAALGHAPAEPARNIFLYYALGKELEDLGDWDAAFDYLERAGAAAKQVSGYDVAADVELIDAIIDTCPAEWLLDAPATAGTDKTPIFIVGLPRTGTTLTERIVSGHSKVQSVGETQLLQLALRGGTRANNVIGITPAQVRRAAARAPAEIAVDYVASLRHRLGSEPYFTEKLPENVLYLGFIAKAWPDAPIVHLRRHPMDACFAMFKQSYFRYAYTLDDLADYYLAYDRLSRHWRALLGDRLLEVRYEDLVSDIEGQTRRLLDHAGLDFEPACLDFATNATPVATASSVQVRSGLHTRSVGKWLRFEQRLEPLRRRLLAGGVSLE